MPILTDGIRSDQKRALAKRIAGNLSGDQQKTLVVDGYTISARQGKARIGAPAGIIVAEDTPAGMDVHLADLIGAPARKYTITGLPARNGAFEFLNPFIAINPTLGDYADVYINRYLAGHNVAGTASRRVCMNGKAAKEKLFNSATPLYKTASVNGFFLGGKRMTVHVEEFLNVAMLHVETALGLTRIDITLGVLAPYLSGLTWIGLGYLTRVDDDDARLYLRYLSDGQIGVVQLAILNEDGEVGVYYAGHLADPYLLDYNYLPRSNGGSTLDTGTAFQDEFGRLCEMPMGSVIRRINGDMTVTEIAAPWPPQVVINHVDLDISLAHGGSYAYVEWGYHPDVNSYANPKAVYAIRHGSPFTGVWQNVPLPDGVVRSCRPLYCDATRQVFLAVTVIDGKSRYAILDTAVSPGWKTAPLADYPVGPCAISVFGRHQYAEWLRTYPSAQYLKEKPAS